MFIVTTANDTLKTDLAKFIYAMDEPSGTNLLGKEMYMWFV